MTNTPAPEKVTMAPTRIYVVRHGTTLLNRQNRYRGRIDVPLDAGGWQDAWSAAAELENVGLAEIYSSPLRRARDTAQVVADAAGLTRVLDLPGLVNLDYGDWQGMTTTEAEALDAEAFAAYKNLQQGAVCPGGESLDLAGLRTLASLKMIAMLHPGGTIGAVSHAVIVRLAIALITDAPRPAWRRNLPNGSVTVFEATPDEVRVVSIPVTNVEAIA
jgi:broad specificity phosphatase PhoE